MALHVGEGRCVSTYVDASVDVGMHACFVSCLPTFTDGGM